MRRLATLAVAAALLSPTVASGQDYTFGDWARDQGYEPGDVMPDEVYAQFSSIDSLIGIGEFDWTTTPTWYLVLFGNQLSSIEFTLAILPTCAVAARAQQRTWTDDTGKFSVEAEFVETKQDSVVLKKSSGSVITVPVARLSETDRRYLQALAEEPSSEPIAPAPKSSPHGVRPRPNLAGYHSGKT